jgi:hypothetical protein
MQFSSLVLSFKTLILRLFVLNYDAYVVLRPC